MERTKFFSSLRTSFLNRRSVAGGMILALGLASVGFMGFKFYKARLGANYHTL
jgi:hypothetical protein